METYSGYPAVNMGHLGSVPSAPPYQPPQPQPTPFILQIPHDALKVECHHTCPPSKVDGLAERISQIQWGRAAGRLTLNATIVAFFVSQPGWAVAVATPVFCTAGAVDGSTSTFNGIAVGLLARGGSHLLSPMSWAMRGPCLLDKAVGVSQIFSGLALLRLTAWWNRPPAGD